MEMAVAEPERTSGVLCIWMASAMLKVLESPEGW